jgi:hypothetical protein
MPVKEKFDVFEVHQIVYKNDERFPFMLVKYMPGLFIDGFSVLKFDQRTNEERRFKAYLDSNTKSLECLCVYAFWIVVAKWLPGIGLSQPFTAKISAAFSSTIMHLQWTETGKLTGKLTSKQKDKVMDFNLLFIAEVVRSALIAKIKNHMLKINDEPVFLLLCETVYELMYGHVPSKSYLFTLIKLSTKSLRERILHIDDEPSQSPASKRYTIKNQA